MKKGYAYIDKGGIVHVVEGIQTAIDYAKKGTEVIAFEGEYKGGYPVVNGEMIIVYGPEEMKIDAHGGNIAVIPALADIYRKCSKAE